MNKRYLLVPVLTLSIAACTQPHRGGGSNDSKQKATDVKASEEKRDSMVEKAFQTMKLDGWTRNQWIAACGVTGSVFVGLTAYMIYKNPEAREALGGYIDALSKRSESALKAVLSSPGFVKNMATKYSRMSALAVATGWDRGLELVIDAYRRAGIPFIKKGENIFAYATEADVIQRLAEENIRYNTITAVDTTFGITLDISPEEKFELVPFIEHHPTLSDAKKVEIITAMVKGRYAGIDGKGPQMVTALWGTVSGTEVNDFRLRAYLALGADPFAPGVDGNSVVMELAKVPHPQKIALVEDFSKRGDFSLEVLNRKNDAGDSLKTILEAAYTGDLAAKAQEIIGRASEGNKALSSREQEKMRKEALKEGRKAARELKK